MHPSIQRNLSNSAGLAGGRQITLFGFFLAACFLELTETGLVFANQSTDLRVIDIPAIGMIIDRTFRILL
jgi:hypothetical protein